MAEVPRPVRSVLRSPVDEESYQRMWRAVGVRRAAAWRRAERGATRWAVGLSAAALAAAVIGLVATLAPERTAEVAHREAPGPLLTEAGDAPTQLTASTGAGDRMTRFEDGSVIRVEGGTTVRAVENSGEAFSTELVAGTARFEVEPGGPRRWSVDCELALVEVVGTVFEVERSEGRARVAVERGRVRVRDRVRGVTHLLGPGEEVVVERERASAPTPPEPVPVPEADEPEATAPPTGRWRRLAQDGDYHAAWRQLGRRGLARESRRASPEDLLALADVARLSGHPAEAVAPLEQLVREHPSDANAGLAALTLGVIHMDQLGQPAPAAAAFERSLDLGLPTSLQQDALARLAVSRGRAGDRAGAAAAAARYLDRFPDGSRRSAVRRWAAEE